MRLSFSLLAIVLASLGIFLLISREPRGDVMIVDAREQDTVSIVLSEEGFIPRYVLIRKGTTINFTTTREYQFWPASNEHPAHTMYSAFDPQQPLESEDSWSFVFDRAGEWSFHDHVRSYYTGIIYVEE
ncbi:hypothetical protein COU18_02285 [Candidatus Kaiserbacteria bacterium CG10_big_fil_rev_8_21_14_0_10_51_14]|uniref:EfeO-type cupredoxin-like domain-containing protein n=1 Tax=Candidatus Kaiserbacteria bacterium CG10_big_fil_rev_8_21_14_0_10_51_14 TaxID=1974610 RepID=A0A2H0UBK7_9BACT|nr:MAG: hypothetical protein COU18_02285 [Candidatus Kaiserbacteria bacterium CG10_big_fil_rev_8_21_14_0_10_51_14]